MLARTTGIGGEVALLDEAGPALSAAVVYDREIARRGGNESATARLIGVAPETLRRHRNGETSWRLHELLGLRAGLTPQCREDLVRFVAGALGVRVAIVPAGQVPAAFADDQAARLRAMARDCRQSAAELEDEVYRQTAGPTLSADGGAAVGERVGVARGCLAALARGVASLLGGAGRGRA